MAKSGLLLPVKASDFTSSIRLVMSSQELLKVVTVTAYFPAHGGGIELVAQKLVNEFIESGLSVEWISSDVDSPPTSTCHSETLGMASSNIVERLTQLPYPIWWPSAFPTLWRAIGTADLVHVHEHPYFGSILSVLVAKLRGRPIIITQHMGALGVGGPLFTWLLAIANRMIGKLMFSMATRVVFISDNVRSFFKLQSSAKACLIFNGVDIRQFSQISHSEREKLRDDLGFPRHRKVVLFVGRFVRKKGLHVISALARRMPEILWVFVGSGPEEPAKWDLGNVTVVERVGHEELARYYRTSDLLFLPSSGEGLPLVVQEALACGLAVLSTDEVANACPGAKNMIRSFTTPRINADPTGWEQILRATLGDADYLNGRDERAARAQALWSWKLCASQYLLLFRAVCTHRAQH